MIILIFMLITFLYPFIYLINISISDGTSAAQYGLHLIPKGVTLKFYKLIFQTDTIITGYKNTIFRTVLGTVLMVLFTSFGAYPLSKKYLPNRALWTTFVLITIFVDGGLIPTYLLIKNLGLIDTRWALIIPFLANTFNVVIMRNFLMTIPDSIEESAKIDGANDIIILFRVVLPLSTPIIATIALWSAVWHWNSWFEAMIYTPKPELTVLQLVLYKAIRIGSMKSIVGTNTGDTTVYPDILKAAVIIINTIPIILVYPFAQKYFMKGIYVGAIKG